MNKTLRLSFKIKNTYRVNSILYSIRQLPLLKKVLPAGLYDIHGFKVLAQVISIIRQIISTFVGKGIYMGLLFLVSTKFLQKVPSADGYLHVLFFLTLIGAIINASMLEPTWDKYYAMILLRMDAKEYTLWNYGYELARMAIGFLPFSLLLGILAGCPIWFSVLFPACVVCGKLVAAAVWLWQYKRKGFRWLGKNRIQVGKLIATLICLLVGFGLPVVGFCLPSRLTELLFCLWIPAGLLAAKQLADFSQYRVVNQQILCKMVNQMDDLKSTTRNTVHSQIAADQTIQSNRSGFEYLNELFVKRHKSILWNSSRIITGVSILAVGVILALELLVPELQSQVSDLLLENFSFFAFVMYGLNRGTAVTRAMFMNCDHSLLTYSLYRKPKSILRMFQIRLRELVKINILPAVVIGAGLCLLLYYSGKVVSPWVYAQMFASTICMSVFFSVHYLVLYYLLQPYNRESEMKSTSYSIATGITYGLCFALYKLKLPLKVFGVGCIAFCVVYCIIACVLVYFFAPKTFGIKR